MHYRLYPVDPLAAESGQAWDYVGDQVMGGCSNGRIVQQQENGAWMCCLQGYKALAVVEGVIDFISQNFGFGE
ncbi:hypothetical protein P8S54_02600 [Thiomicrospira sp. R3]|uniref:hypothetical protein n=1 Tax=Thiomicrospira sp. R3 TaxID=3035472 RepID=UPI00259BDB99|nr:hypothetical protein [Thiomicrospira sp. R3]WFE69209.1 hypothetical protein P8S54_02600 [Thiomicrospira sp. R3]